MKNIIIGILLILSLKSFGQAGASAVIDVSPDKYEFQSQSILNQLKTVYQQEKQVIQQSQLVKTTAEAYKVSQSMYSDINKMYQMQNKMANDYKKFSKILSMNQQDINCIFDRLGQMMKMGLPKNYNGNLGSMMRSGCDYSASLIYNLLNPYNGYSKSDISKYSIFSSANQRDPKSFTRNFKEAIHQSNQANMAINDLDQKNKVELAGMYSRLSEDQMNQAKATYNELRVNNSDRKPEVEYAMLNRADELMRQSMENKKISLELLSSLKDGKSELEKTEERKQNSKLVRAEISQIKPFKYGN